MNNDVKIIISADGTQAQAGVRRVESSLDALKNSVAGVERHTDALTGSFARMGHAAAAIFSGREVIQAVDAWSSLNAQLKITTGSTEAAGRAYQDVVTIALATGQSLTDVGTIYKRFADQSAVLGLSQTRVAGITETVAQAIALSGGSAASAQAALTQFGQALASGTLRGEELNSVLEQAPRLAKTLADGLGVPVGQLRSLAEQGKITSEEMVKALEGQAGKIGGEFVQLPLTVGRALQNMQTAFTDTVGSFEQGTGAFRLLAEGLDGVAGHMGAVATAGGALATVMLGRMVSATVAHAAAATAGAAASRLAAAAELEQAVAANALAISQQRAAGAIGATVGALEALAASAARAAAAQAAATATSRGAMVMGALGGPIGLVTTALSLGAVAWMTWKNGADDATKDTAAKATERISSIIAKIEEMNGRLAGATRTQTTAQLAAGATELKNVDADIEYRQKRLDQIEASQNNNPATGYGLNAEKKAITDELVALDEKRNKLRSVMEQSRADMSLVGSTAIAAFIESSATGAAKVGVEVRKVAAEAAAAFDKAGGFDASNPQHQQANKALAAKVDEIRKKGTDKGGVKEKAPSAVFEGGMAGFDLSVATGAQDKDAEARYQKFRQFRKEEIVASQTANDLITRSNFIGQERVSQLAFEAGLIGKTAAETRRLTAEREISLALERDLLALSQDSRLQDHPEEIARVSAALRANAEAAKAAAVAQAELSSEWTTGARRSLDDYIKTATDAAGQAEQAMTGAFRSMEDALVSMVTSGKADFKSLANSILADLARIAVRQNITGPLAQSMAGLFSGGGNGYGAGGADKPTAGGQGFVWNAKGGVYNSPSLSAYSGGVYDSPRAFTFAKGTGIFAEAGPEAIMPLSRDSRGQLGVRVQGAGAGQEAIMPLSRDATGRLGVRAPSAGNSVAQITASQKVNPAPFKFAKGAAFTNQIVTGPAPFKFAKGAAFTNQIVTGPTPFKFAKGAGLMGEAGPEAIMPLSRDASGRLGVKAEGGGGSNVSIVINNTTGQPASTREVSDGRGGRRIEVTIGDMVASELQRTGSAPNRAMKSGFGVQQNMTRR